MCSEMPVIRETAGGICSPSGSAIRQACGCVTVSRARAQPISRRCPRGAAAVAWQSMTRTSRCDSCGSERLPGTICHHRVMRLLLRCDHSLKPAAISIGGQPIIFALSSPCRPGMSCGEKFQAGCEACRRRCNYRSGGTGQMLRLSGLLRGRNPERFDSAASVRRSTVRLKPDTTENTFATCSMVAALSRDQDLQDFASFQFSPNPTSTVSGTFITAADCILSRTIALNSSARAFGTSNSSSSWTVRIMRASG